MRSFRLLVAFCIGWLAASDAVSAAPDKSPRPLEIVPQLGHSSWIESVSITPDGKHLLTASQDKTIKIWDMASGRLVRTLTSAVNGYDSVYATLDEQHVIASVGRGFAITPDGLRAISGSEVIEIWLWNIETGQRVSNLGKNLPASEPSFEIPQECRPVPEQYADERSKREDEESIRLYDLTTGRQICSFNSSYLRGQTIAISPDGKHFVSSTDFREKFKVRDLATGKVIRAFTGSIDSAVFLRDGRRFATGGKDKIVRLWDIASGRMIRSFEGHSRAINAVTATPDGRYLLTGSKDKTIKLWNVESGQLLRTFSGHKRSVSALAVTPDGGQFISGSQDHTAKLWSLRTGQLVRTFAGRAGMVNALHVTPDGRYLATARTWDSTIKLWDLESGSMIRRFSDHDLAHATSVVVTDDRRFLIAGDLSKYIKIWDFKTGQLVRRFEAHTDWVQALAVSAKGDYLASGSTDKTIKVWNLTTGELIQTFEGHSKDVTSIDVSPDGDHLVSSSWDGTIRMWNVSTGKQVRSFKGHELGNVKSVKFTRDAKYIVSGGQDTTVRIWEVATGKAIRILKGALSRSSEGHQWAVNSIALTPDDRHIVSGSGDDTVKLWDIKTGRILHTFDGHLADVNFVAVTPDGRYLVSGSADGTIKVWNLAERRPVLTFIAQSNNGEWASVVTEGFFNFSAREASNRLSIVKGTRSFDLFQVYQSLYSSDLVREALAGDPDGEVKRAAEIVNLEKVIASGTVPEISVELVSAEKETESELITTKVDISDAGGGIGRVEWRVNGLTVGVHHPEVNAKALKLDRAIPLDPGENTIEVVAYNGKDLLSSLPATTKITFKPKGKLPKPTLHVLAIGVNHYSDDVFRPLNLAVADAEAFGRRIKAAGKGLYEKVAVTTVTSPGATLEKIEWAINDIGRKAHPRDTFILFAAAHGKSEQGRFHLIPEDFSSDGPGTMAERAIDQDRLQDWIANRIKAKRGLVLLDTCESGAVVASHLRSVTQAAASEAGIGRLHQAIGRPVLTAAAADQVALEGYGEGDRKHGVFTYAVLDALTRGDANNNGTIEVSELAGHVQSLAPIFSQELRSGVSRPKRTRAAEPVMKVGQTTRRPINKQKPKLGSPGEDFVLVNRLAAGAHR